MPVDARPTLSAPDDDPYLWLEDIDGARALAWVESQNATTLRQFGDGQFSADRDTLRDIFDRSDNIPFPNRRRATLFNPWQDAQHPRGLWRTTTLQSFRSGTPDWTVLIDLDALAAKEGEDWVWRGGISMPGTHDRAIVQLSRGGSDAVVLREFDIASRTFVPDGFYLPEAKSSIDWLDRDTLLLASPLGPGMATRTGYARTVRLWRRGSDPLTAPVIFETREDFAGAWAWLDREAPEERLWFVDKPGYLDANIWLGNRTGPKTRLEIPSDAWAQLHRGWLALKLRTPWSVGGAAYPADALIGTPFADFLAGSRAFVRLYEPGDRKALQHSFWCGGRLVLSILDDLKPRFETLTPAPGEWKRDSLKGLPEISSVNVWPFDTRVEESNGDLLALVHDPLTPPSLYLIEPSSAPILLKRAPAAFDAQGLVITRHEAVSTDGMRVPYVQVGPAGTTGDAPVHMYGYGGFGASLTAYYNSAVGKLWLERGGTSVITHLRGGREFGTAWHEAGRRAGKKLAHDDFASIAADLVRRGVTRPDRIAAEGGSNGGLLIANMLTRYPERFGALFCTVPVIDMRRSPKLLAGTWWIDEYGDPDKPEDWAFLSAISAYHVAEPGRPYPPILIATSRRDDRVHPGHARKMAAKLQAMGYEAHFYEPATGGHGYGKDNLERATFTALGYRFLREKIRWGVATQ
jgi:prolyl oligopeptidase